jgi:hypothetical protein
METFLVKVFTEGKKVVGKAFLFKKRFVLKEKTKESGEKNGSEINYEIVTKRESDKDMKKKPIVGSIAIAAIVAVAIFAGCIEEDVPLSTKLPKIPGLTEFFNPNPNVTEQTLPYVKASGSRVCLVNYKNATDPTWDELISFLEGDDTDEHPYIEDSFVCADFAEMLHNNAEASGIKAAYVGVDFVVGEGHAINTFNTTDKGLVYVDCTRGFSAPITAELTDSEKREEREHDKIAYVVEGKEYGLISIDKATSSEYWFYEDYTEKWEELGKDIEAYNNDVEVYNKNVKAYKSVPVMIIDTKIAKHSFSFSFLFVLLDLFTDG